MYFHHALKKVIFRKADKFTIDIQNPLPEGERYYCKMTFYFKFGYPAIIQQFKFTKIETNGNPFIFGSIEGNLFGDLIKYERFLDTAMNTRKIRNSNDDIPKEVIYYNTSGVGELVKMTFYIDNGFYRRYMNSREAMVVTVSDAFGDNVEDNQEILDNRFKRDCQEAFMGIYEGISFFGISSAKAIKPQNCLYLINIALRFRKEGLSLSANEVELACALALVNEKKNNQALEILKKCVKFLDESGKRMVDHYVQIRNYQISFNRVQKITKQTSEVRFRCALISVLMASISPNDSNYMQKTIYLENAIKYFAKSKISARVQNIEVEKREQKSGDDWFGRLFSLVPQIVKLLSQIIKAEQAKYYKTASMEVYNFLLRVYGGSLGGHIIVIFKSILNFLKINCRNNLYDWEKGGLFEKEVVIPMIKMVTKENEKISKIFEERVFLVEPNDDLYIASTPMLICNSLNFFDNLALLLPSLSAPLLHEIFEVLMKSFSVGNLEIPLAIRLILTKIMEKIIIICQADLNFDPKSLQKIVTIQTLLNNRDYRVRIVQMVDEAEEQELNIKQIFSLHLEKINENDLSLYTMYFSLLWEALKTKFLFLISFKKGSRFLVSISGRLEELLNNLKNQVLTEDFNRLNMDMKQSQQLSIGDLKFERFRMGLDEKARLNCGDVIKSKVEYLKNFRDTFGELEYYLEIIDCLSANFIDKSADIKMNLDPEKKKGKEEEDADEQESEIEKVDDTSKRLVRIYISKEVETESLFERECCETVRVITDVLTDFLVIFMRDGVFIDYFNSTWVILTNFANLLKEKKEEVHIHLIWSLFKSIEVNGKKNYPTDHTIKCVLRTLEIIQKYQNLKNHEFIKKKLLGLMRFSFLQLTHNQNPDIFLMSKELIYMYQSDFKYYDCSILINSLKDPSLDFQSADYQNLLGQFFKCVLKSGDREMFDQIVRFLIKEEFDEKKRNLVKRQMILAKRKSKPQLIVSQKISDELRSQEKLRRLEILAYLVKLSSFELISIFCDSPEENKDIFESEGDMSLYRFFESCMKESNFEFQRGVLKALLCFILLEKDGDNDSNFKDDFLSINADKIKMVRFSYQLMLKMASMTNLRPESMHDLMVLSLILFSKIFPPANFEKELQLFNQFNSNQSMMMNSSRSLFKNLDWEKQSLEDVNMRFYEVSSFESFGAYIDMKQKVDTWDVNYTNVRIQEMFKLYVYIRSWLDSPWSSIKGLVCNFISYLVPCTSGVLDEHLKDLIRTEIGALLQKLMGSTESEAIISGLNILGSFCGFGQDSFDKIFDFRANAAFFKRNSEIVPIEIWERVHKLQKSWDLTIQIASIVIYQMALPPDYQKYISKKSKESALLNEHTNSIMSVKKEEQNKMTANKSKDKSFGMDSDEEDNSEQSDNEDRLKSIISAYNSKGFESSPKKKGKDFWLQEEFADVEIKRMLGIFKLNFVVEENVWIEQQFTDNRIMLKIKDPETEEFIQEGQEHPIQIQYNLQKRVNRGLLEENNDDAISLESRNVDPLDSRSAFEESFTTQSDREIISKNLDLANEFAMEDIKSNMFHEHIKDNGIFLDSSYPRNGLILDKLKIKKKKNSEIQSRIEDSLKVLEKIRETSQPISKRSASKKSSRALNNKQNASPQSSKRSSESLTKRPLSLEDKEKIKKYTKELSDDEIKKRYNSKLTIRKKKKKNSIASTSSKPDTVKSLSNLYTKSSLGLLGKKESQSKGKKRTSLRENYSSFRYKFYNKSKNENDRKRSTKDSTGMKTKRRKSSRKEISSLLTSHFLKPNSRSKNLTEGSMINIKHNRTDSKSQSNIHSKSIRTKSRDSKKKSLTFEKNKFFGKAAKGLKNSSTGTLKYKNLDYKGSKKTTTHFKSVRTSSSDKVLNNLKSKIYNKMSNDFIKKHVSKYTKQLANSKKFSKKSSSSIQKVFSSKN